jgi:hypothetical protein
MPVKIAFQLIPLERISGQQFDLSRLPFSIMPNVEVADVSELLPPSMFEFLKADVGRYRMRFFEGTVKHAFVHRYEEQPEATTWEESVNITKKNDELLNEVFACSRIVRPTRRHGSVTGYVNANGKVDQRGATFPRRRLRCS